jgi:hypothetical protein
LKTGFSSAGRRIPGETLAPSRLIVARFERKTGNGGDRTQKANTFPLQPMIPSNGWRD